MTVSISQMVSYRVEKMLGCKWSLHILGLIRRGVRRPGAIVRSSKGLSPKVMNERLAKMIRFEILQKKVYPGLPLKVEYHLTSFGKRFIKILDAIARLK